MVPGLYCILSSWSCQSLVVQLYCKILAAITVWQQRLAMQTYATVVPVPSRLTPYK